MTPCRSTKLGLFRGHEGGNAAMMFGLALVPLLGFVGAALDYSSATGVQAQLQKATDGAALAGISHLKKTDHEVRQAVRSYLDAILPPHLHNQPFEIDIREGRTVLVVRAETGMPTRFMRVLGKDEVKVTSMSEARKATDSAEVALRTNTPSRRRPGRTSSALSRLSPARSRA
jgi:Flp pilus assembly protein TadG